VISLTDFFGAASLRHDDIPASFSVYLFTVTANFVCVGHTYRARQRQEMTNFLRPTYGLHWGCHAVSCLPETKPYIVWVN